jgi:transposase
MMQVPTPCPTCLPGSPVSNVTSFPAAVVADTIVRTVELGVTITDAAVDGDVTVVFCNLLDDGQRRCPGCGGEGVYRDTVVRKVTDVPVVGHPLRLRVRVPRYRCTAIDCDREVFAHNTSRLARPGWSTTRRCARYILRRLMIDRMTVAAVARELGLSWDTVQHHRPGRHPDDRGRRHHPPRRRAGHRRR